MNTIRKQIQSLLKLAFLAILMSGCEFEGLDLQQPYEYDYNAGMRSNELKMTAWEFMQSRPDLFSIMTEGVKYAGLEDMYKQPNSTYLLLADKAFNSTTESDYSYFMTHLLPDPLDVTKTIVPESLDMYPADQVKELLLYHIAKGTWTWSNLPAIPTWYDTYASADTAKISMYLLKDRNPNITFNNFEGHYKLTIKARTTNLKTSNGSYVHVLESWMDRPTQAQLK